MGYLVLSKVEKDDFYELFEILFSRSVCNSHTHMNPNTTAYEFVAIPWILRGCGRLWVRGKGWYVVGNGGVYTHTHTAECTLHMSCNEFSLLHVFPKVVLF